MGFKDVGRMALVIVNFILWVNSAVLLIRVLLAVNVIWVNSVFIESPSLPTITIVLFILFLVAAFFACGIVSQNHYCLRGFYGFLLMASVVEMLIGGYVYYLTNISPNLVSNNMEHSMKQYGNDTKITRNWDYLQREFHCCGVKNATDWLDVIGHLPLSCCDGLPVGAPCTIDLADTMSCVQSFMDFLGLKYNLTIMLIIVAVVQIIFLYITLACNWPGRDYIVL